MHPFRSHLAAARLVALLGVAVLASACSSDSPTGPGSSQFDVSGAISQMTVPGMSSAMASAGYSSNTDASAPAIVPSACGYSSSTQSFTCPTVTSNGLTITRSYTLLDAQGQPQSAPDKATTDGVKTVVTISGTPAMNNGNVTVYGNRVMTLSGLLANKPLLNGKDTTAMKGTMTMGTTSVPIDFSMLALTNALQLPPKGSTTKYPLGGSVAMTMVSTGLMGSTPTTTNMTMTFDGTSTATLVLTNTLGTQTCTIDLTGQTAMSCKP